MSLLYLPTELFQHIVQYVPSIYNLRLSCHSAETRSFNIFAERFTKWRVMRSRRSIDTLISISKSRLRDSIRTLQIGTELLDDECIGKYPHLYSEYLKDQVYICKSGWCTKNLAVAFRRLSNLNGIEIWLFDEDNPLQYSWGVRSMMRELNEPADIFVWELEATLSTAVIAIDASSAKVNTIAIQPMLQSCPISLGLSLTAFVFPESQRQCLRSLSNLRTLKISIQTTSYDTKFLTTHFFNFLSAASNLHTLHLGALSPDFEFTWLLDCIHIGHLQEFSLQDVEVHGNNLVGFLGRHLKLRRVFLNRILLVSGNWRSVLPKFRDRGIEGDMLFERSYDYVLL
jgi:hypothetical protein